MGPRLPPDPVRRASCACSGCEHRIGFFLHIPFPPPDCWWRCPTTRISCEALCAYDVVGFHTATDLRCFIDYIRSRGAAADERPTAAISSTPSAARWSPAPSRSASTPNHFATLAEHADGAYAQTERLRESLVGRDLIIGVDRLDYSKGLPRALRAFQLPAGELPEPTRPGLLPPDRAAVPRRRAGIHRDPQGARDAEPATSTAASRSSTGCRSATSTTASPARSLAGLLPRRARRAGDAACATA